MRTQFVAVLGCSMEAWLLVAKMAAMMALSSAGAEFSIGSLDRSGKLTWTNPSTNAICGLEAAASSAGPWFASLFSTSDDSAISDLLTNQTSAWPYPHTNAWKAVPRRFYRLVWVNWPPLTNSFQYSGYDSQGCLAITGRLDLIFFHDNSVSGTWDLERTALGTNDLGPQIGHGDLYGTVSTNVSHLLSLNLELHPHWIGGNVRLAGVLCRTVESNIAIYSGYTGTWGVDYEFPPRPPGGRFVAQRIPKGR